MIEINTNPIILTIGSFKIGWGFIMAVVAAIVALPVFVTIARRFGIQKVHIVWLCFLTVISGYIGAILFLVTENLIVYHSIDTVNFGLRADGFFIAVTIPTLIYAKITKLSFWQLLDIGAPCLILYMVVYRIGCVLVGCCYGLPLDQPWAVIYNNPNSPAPLGTPIHPTQLYHLIWNVIALVIIWILRKRFKVPGTLGLFAWVLYFLGDFPIRFVRGNEPPVLGLSLSQITDLIAISAAAYLLVLRFKSAVQREDIDS
ncbi:MAG: prolipoprotein diacylglyceryl transferase [Chloroflexota bacterium]|nr:MAG: prolipoprotein diacylglyceryl transferase [Chloroflexota bacterium]